MIDTRFYIVTATDKPGLAELRQQTRPAHRAYLRSQSLVQIYAAGPLLEEHRDAMNGTFILCGAGSRNSVDAFIAADPYARSGLFAEVSIRRLDWTLGNPLASGDEAPTSTVTQRNIH